MLQTTESGLFGAAKALFAEHFSGGNPSRNGDFSGVAKNSYYIEDGKTASPIRETMISGNVFEAFQNMKAISKELVNYGYAVAPWIAFSGMSVSGR